MGKQGGNSGAVGGSSSSGSGGGSDGGSSIALLQERFRQLQKMREKRREKELLKMFPEPETMSQTNRYEPQTSSVAHHETTRRPCFQDSLTLGLDLHTKQAKPQTRPHKPPKTKQFTDYSLVDSASVSTNKPEVDTTLHL